MLDRLYACLVRLILPGPMVARLGEDLLICYREVMRSARGPGHAVAVWFREIAHLVAAAWHLRREPPDVTRRSGSWWGALRDDVIHARRSLLRSPGSTAVAVLIMGVGLGAATSVYSAVRHTLLHPLPYESSDRIASLWQTAGEGNLIPPTSEQAETWGGQTDMVEGVLRLGTTSMTLDGRRGSESLFSVRISEDYFRTLGVGPALGRSFAPDELVDGGPNSVVLGYGMWMTRFGADPDVLGTAITLNGEPWTVIGVGPKQSALPTGFPEVPRLFLPLRTSDRASSTVVILREHVDLEQYNDRIKTLVEVASTETEPSSAFGGVAMSPTQMMGGRIRRSLTLLSVAVGLLLLIACLNVSSLLVNRADRRRHETAVKMALGVGRARLFRQQGLESLLLAAAAGFLGIVVAGVGVEATRVARPEDLRALDRIQLDPPVLVFGIAVALLTGLVVGLLPALRAGSVRALASLRAGHEADNRATTRARWALVVGELALSFALLVGSALLVRNLIAVHGGDRGFDPEGLVVARVDLPAWAYPENPERAAVWARITEEVQRTAAGPDAVSASGGLPTQPAVYFGGVEVEGVPLEAEEAVRPMFGWGVDANYFALMRQPVVAGRDFTAEEVATGAPVYVVTASTAQRLWSGGPAVGRRMRIGDSEWHTVVGVVADVPVTSIEMVSGLDRSIYAPLNASRARWLVVRTAGDPGSVMTSIRSAIRRVAADAPIELHSMETLMGRSVATHRFITRLLTALGALAALLAGLGLYGVVAQGVGRRTREIGIRISLGAQTTEVVWMFVRSGAVAVTVGIVLGGGLYLAGARIVESQLTRVDTTDPFSFLLAALVLGGTALGAFLLPARRAATIDPVQAIRGE